MSVSSRVFRRIARGGRALLHAIDQLVYPLLSALWSTLARLLRALHGPWQRIRPAWLRVALSLGLLGAIAYALMR